jgi:hypothetical protein
MLKMANRSARNPNHIVSLGRMVLSCLKPANPRLKERIAAIKTNWAMNQPATYMGQIIKLKIVAIMPRLRVMTEMIKLPLT